MSRIYQQVISLAAAAARRKEVRPDMRLIEDLGLDSLKLIELLTDIEDQQGVRISETGVRELRTVDDVCRLVERLARIAADGQEQDRT